MKFRQHCVCFTVQRLLHTLDLILDVIFQFQEGFNCIIREASCSLCKILNEVTQAKYLLVVATTDLTFKFMVRGPGKGSQTRGK